MDSGKMKQNSGPTENVDMVSVREGQASSGGVQYNEASLKRSLAQRHLVSGSLAYIHRVRAFVDNIL